MYWLGKPLSRPATAPKELTEFVPPKGLRWYITDEECNQLYHEDEPMFPIDYLFGMLARTPVVEKNWRALKRDLNEHWIILTFFVPYVILDEDRIKRASYPHRSKIAIIKDGEIQRIINPVLDTLSVLEGVEAIVLREEMVHIPSFFVRPDLVRYFPMEDLFNALTDGDLPWHERTPMRISARRYTLLNKLISIIDEEFS